MQLPNTFCLNELKRYLIYFCLGCFVYDKITLRNLITKIHFLIALCVFIGLYVLKSYFPLVGLEFLAAIFGIIFIMNFSEFLGKFSEKITKPLLVMATCSYTIYLFHTTFMGFHKALLIKPLHGNIMQNELIFIASGLIVITIGVIVPILLHLFVVQNSKVFSFLIWDKVYREREKMKLQ